MIAYVAMLTACSDPSASPMDGSLDSARPRTDAALRDASEARDVGRPLDGLGPADFADGELDAPSHGGTITFQEIGAAGWYPSRRDPEVGPCDAHETATCCLARHEVAGDALTPWDEELIVTLRGPMRMKQIAVYAPAGGEWSLVSRYDSRGTRDGIAFRGNGTESDGFDGTIGTECLVDVSTDRAFVCGPGSEPYCPPGERYYGWEGAKLFVLLAAMPPASELGSPCSDGTDGNWYDAPWIGISLAELVRSGAFSDCHCYARNPAEWWLGDGCGQFNAFEVVNDNNEYRNLDVFSTNFFGYGGYVGEGPCGAQCDVAALTSEADLIDKDTSTEAAAAVASPTRGPGVAFVRPDDGYRYFLVLFDVDARTVQLAIVHPLATPPAIAPLLPDLPSRVSRDVIASVRDARLPH